MGELPVFTCQAHVFTINPSTRKSWVSASSNAIDINFFYDSNKQCYRIVSVEDSLTEKKVVINSTITEKMVFKQTSQKFGQWADSKSSGVYGLGFNSESDLAKFVSQFKQSVDATKRSEVKKNVRSNLISDTGATIKNGPTRNNDMPGAVSLRNTLPTCPTTQLSGYNANSATFATSFQTTAPDICFPDSQLQQQLDAAQNKIRRLEQELLSVKRQAPQANEAGASYSPVKMHIDNTNAIDGVHISDAQTASFEALSNGSLSKSAVMSGTGGGGVIKKNQFDPHLIGTPDTSDITTSPEEQLFKLHHRLGVILKEATDIHTQITLLMNK